MGRESLFVESFDLVLSPPGFEDLGRSAMVKAAVDFTATANAATFDEGDLIFAQSDCLAAVTIFGEHLFERKWVTAFERKGGTFFNEQDVAPGFSQEGGGDSATRAGADHSNFTLQFRL